MYQTIRKVLFSLDPETAHDASHFAMRALQAVPYGTTALDSFFSYSSSRLEQTLWGLSFDNPVGLAAGFDKNATSIDALSALGFGFLELGSVTHQPCSGNDKPRLFRLEKDEALINRMGLNNVGPYTFLKNYHAAKTTKPKLVNISKTNDPEISGDAAFEDVAACYRILGSSAEIVVLDLSCPNMKDGKKFEDPTSLKSILTLASQVRKDEEFTSSLLVKFSSDIDLSMLAQSVELSLEFGIDGFVLCNTSNRRDGLYAPRGELDAIGRGGLSGKPIYEQCLERVAQVYKVSEGKVPVVGLGGIRSGEQALEMMRAGASLVELYTALVYEGPGVVGRMLHEIDAHMLEEGLLSLDEIIGSAS